MFVVGSEAWSCVNPVSVVLSLGRVSTQFLWGFMSTQVVCQPWIVWLCVNTLSIPHVNELIFGLGFFRSTHIVTRWLKLMNLTGRMLSTRKNFSLLEPTSILLCFPFTYWVATISLFTLAVILLRRWWNHGVLRWEIILAGVFSARLCLWCAVFLPTESSLVYYNKTLFL
jgi:hypothetical protein